METAGVDWTNLSALGALIICMVWGITRGLPNLVQSFREELAGQRSDFREELKEHRDQSRVLAESGHDAVRTLSGAINNHAAELQKQFDEIKDRRPTD